MLHQVLTDTHAPTKVTASATAAGSEGSTSSGATRPPRPKPTRPLAERRERQRLVRWARSHGCTKRRARIFARRKLAAKPPAPAGTKLLRRWGGLDAGTGRKMTGDKARKHYDALRDGKARAGHQTHRSQVMAQRQVRKGFS